MQRTIGVVEEGLKGIYWQIDTQRDSMALLKTFISNASKMDLKVFIVKYSSISGTLGFGQK
jgi:hypothetical protein